MCYQTRDLLLAMRSDAAATDLSLEVLRVDGGMTGNNWLLQFLADILDVAVDRPVVTETTALGAAYLAGLQIGMYPDVEAIAAHWRRQDRFTPAMAPDRRDRLYQAWTDAVARVRTVP